MTIEELNDSLTTEQRNQVITKISTEGQIGLATIYRWLSGKSRPTFLYKKLIIESIEKVTGRKISGEISWPA